MVKQCVNPECGNEFRHLNQGDLYALERGSADTRFLWLCAECANRLAIAVSESGEVSVLHLSGVMSRTPANSRARLRLVSARRQPQSNTPSRPISPWSVAFGDISGSTSDTVEAA